MGELQDRLAAKRGLSFGRVAELSIRDKAEI